MVRDFIQRHIVNSLRRNIGAFFIESGMSILKIKDPSVPPIRLDFVGGVDFKATGFEFLRYFTEFGGLKREHTVLDIGSGIGRMAIPLKNYLKNGRYEGVEIVTTGVEWCRKNITLHYPNFHFHHADIYNKSYNPKGIIKASEYRFPFEDNTFDFVFLTSVFTHMLTADVQHYISEIARVLKPGGSVLSTWFLLNDEVETLMRNHRDVHQIVHPVPGHQVVRTINPNYPEDAAGYDVAFIKELFGENGLPVKKVIYGSWCGREDFTSFQDMVVARKS